ncbi:YbhB/YbcL family Raf kinase inhibitor-like protein [Humibacter sp. BT305]|nr:YbhB/YbcL family Raf kinase inhibitor-like protein [Humibacter sp. BT305]
MTTTSSPISTLTVTSTDIEEGGRFGAAHYSAMFGVPGGEDRSPQLSWTGAPESTRSFVVSVHDPDAPTPSGFWHWMIADLPATTRELQAGLGQPEAPAWTVKNDARAAQFIGSAPPVGSGPHHYAFTVYALDVASIKELGLDEEATPAFVTFNILPHIVATGTLTVIGER